MTFADLLKSDIVHSFSGFAHLVFHIWPDHFTKKWLVSPTATGLVQISLLKCSNCRKWLSTNFHAHIMTIFKGLITSTRSHDNDIIPRDRPSMELIITVDLLCWTYHFHATSRIADFLKKKMMNFWETKFKRAKIRMTLDYNQIKIFKKIIKKSFFAYFSNSYPSYIFIHLNNPSFSAVTISNGFYTSTYRYVTHLFDLHLVHIT